MRSLCLEALSVKHLPDIQCHDIIGANVPVTLHTCTLLSGAGNGSPHCLRRSDVPWDSVRACLHLDCPWPSGSLCLHPETGRGGAVLQSHPGP